MLEISLIMLAMLHNVIVFDENDVAKQSNMMPVDHYILPRVHNILSLYYELLILRILCKPKCI